MERPMRLYLPKGTPVRFVRTVEYGGPIGTIKSNTRGTVWSNDAGTVRVRLDSGQIVAVRQNAVREA